MLSFYKHSKEKNLYALTTKLFILTLIASIFVFCRVNYTNALTYIFLIWNIFLAWLPLYFSLVFINHKFKNKIYTYLIGFLWLIFYPNSPYILTDFIHLSRYKFYETTGFDEVFNTNLAIWYDFFLISLFAVIALVLSYISLSIMHKFIKEKFNNLYGWIFVIIISILSGFAIYLGRFIRLNSWNLVTHPMYLIDTIFNNFNFYALVFTLLFSILILFSYITLSLINKYNTQNL